MMLAPGATLMSVGRPAGPSGPPSVWGTLPLSRVFDTVLLCVPFKYSIGAHSWGGVQATWAATTLFPKLPSCPTGPVTKRDACTGLVLQKMKSSFSKALNRNSSRAFLGGQQVNHALESLRILFTEALAIAKCVKQEIC